MGSLLLNAAWVVVLGGADPNVLAAEAVTKALVQGVSNAQGKAPGLVMLGRFRGPPKSAAAGAFESALIKAFANAGVRLVDQAALREVIVEAELSEGDLDASLAEMAAAFGAAVLVTGTLERAGDSAVVHARAVDTRTAKILATARQHLGEPSGAAALEARTLEAELRRLADTLAKGIDAMPGEARYQRFAVLPFDQVGALTHEKQLGLLVTAELTTLLHRDHNLMIVERGQLQRVLEELSLGQTGLTDPSQTVEVGKLSGAQGLILGSVSEVGDHYAVDARVVSVQDGQIAYAAQARLPAADLVALSSEAVVLRTRSGAVYRSLLMPGWGQFYNRQEEKGALFVATELAAAGLAGFFHYRGGTYAREYEDLAAGTSPDVFAATRADAENAYSRRNWALIALAVVHLANILDAVWNGKSFDSATPSTSGGGMGYAP